MSDLEIDPFGEPAPWPAAANRAPIQEAWAALAAALRPVAASVWLIGEAELRRPSWRPGETLEEAAFSEGRKQAWRDLMAGVERRG